MWRRGCFARRQKEVAIAAFFLPEESSTRGLLLLELGGTSGGCFDWSCGLTGLLRRQGCCCVARLCEGEKRAGVWRASPLTGTEGVQRKVGYLFFPSTWSVGVVTPLAMHYWHVCTYKQPDGVPW